MIAIALGEESRNALLEAIEGAAERVVSSVSLLEGGIVLRARAGDAGLRLFTELVEALGCEVAAFDEAQARLAIAAFARFGKGMGHRAQLNFGDCAVYALARSRGDRILATGGDFTATDIAILRP